jgi:hypothetical protein
MIPQSYILAVIIVLLLLVIGYFVYDKFYQTKAAAATNTATNQLTDLNNAVKAGDTQSANSIYQEIVRTNNSVDVSDDSSDTSAAKATTLQAVAAAQTIMQQSNVAIPTTPVNATLPVSEVTTITPVNSYTVTATKPAVDVVQASNNVTTTTQPLPVSDIQQAVYTSNTSAPAYVTAVEDTTYHGLPTTIITQPIQIPVSTSSYITPVQTTVIAPTSPVTSISNTTTSVSSSTQTPSSAVSIAPNTYIIKHTKSGLALRWRNTDTSKGTVVEFKALDKKDRNQYFNIYNNRITLPDGRCFGINTADGNLAKMIACDQSTVDTMVTAVSGGTTIIRAGCIAAGNKDAVNPPTSGNNLQWRCGGKVSSNDWLYTFVPVT